MGVLKLTMKFLKFYEIKFCRLHLTKQHKKGVEFQNFAL